MTEHADTNGWRHVHPLTPVVRTVIVAVAIVAVAVANAHQLIQDQVEAYLQHDEPPTKAIWRWAADNPLYLLAGLAVLVVVLALVVGGNWLTWKYTRFRLGSDAVYLHQGVLSKKQRSARLDRVQAIDVNQPLLARIVGLATLNFDVAGGKNSNIAIGYLRRAEAFELRDEMLARVRAAKAGEQPAVGTAQGATQPQGTRPGPGGPAVPDPGPGTGPGAAPGAAPRLSPGAGAQPGGASAPGAQTFPGATQSAGPADATGERGTSVGSRLLAGLAHTGQAVGQDIEGTLREALAAYTVDPRVDAAGRLLRIPAHQVLLSQLLSAGTIVGVLFILAVIIGVIIAVSIAGGEVLGALLSAAIPVVIAFVSVFYAQAKSGLQYANFSVALTADGLTITTGLTTTVRRVIPLDRIQAVRVSQPLLWRGPDWWKVEYNFAGGSDVSDAKSIQTVLLPVGSREQALMLLGLALPDPGRADAREFIFDAMDSTDHRKPGNTGFGASPAVARWLDPLTYKRNGSAPLEHMEVIRGGRLHRWVDFVPYARVQSLRLEQGPLQRRFHLMTIELHSTAGPIHPRILHLDPVSAQNKFMALGARTQRARDLMDGRARI
ncbi:PH domain-containing protein [Brevibacterium moorei]|uniref:PH domain-containing protein n=1 Tax=Brevibacterium moorei TaxID=2968457 RepID=UPI0027957902|nr:PH domain-containing protein [Brevibacterium sp. 68QC2CO]